MDPILPAGLPLRAGPDLGRRPAFARGLLLAAALFAGDRFRAADCDSNGIDDAAEIAQGTAVDCDGNGVPDRCDLAGPLRFEAPRGYSVGNAARWVAAGDYDGDGDSDLAAVGRDDEVAILLNDGSGAFGRPAALSTGREPAHLVSFDLDGDRLDDLVIPNLGSGDLTILRHRADGGWLGAEPVAVAELPIRAAVADVDGDGDMDLLVTHQSSHLVSLLLGDGRGRFDRGAAIDGGRNCTCALPVHFDGDDRVDLVVTNRSDEKVGLLLNRGDGTFARASESVVGTMPSNLAAGDFDGDGDLDVAVSCEVDDCLSVFVNDRAGRLNAPVVVPRPDADYRLIAGDLDRDGDDDLVATGSIGGWNPIIECFLADGAGTFPSRIVTATGFPTTTISVADFDADGRLDLAVGAEAERSLGPGGSVFVMRNLGGPSFAAPAAGFPVGDSAWVLTSADADGDGLPDYFVAYQSAPRVQIVRNRGIDGLSFGPWIAAGVEIADLAATDLDGDGDPDLLGVGGDHLLTFANDGAGSFANPAEYPVGVLPRSIAVSDLDGDGRPDVAVANFASDSITVLRNAGDGRLSSGVEFPVGSDPICVRTGDLDGDRREDLVVALQKLDSAEGAVSVLLGKGDGGFAEPAEYPARASPSALALADLDGDGDADVGVGHEASDKVSILRGDGHGGLGAPEDVTTGDATDVVLAGDLDGDCLSELVARAITGEIWIVEHIRGEGFLAETHYRTVGAERNGMILADGDADGRLDLASVRHSPGALVILRNVTPPGSRDCDADGVPDACATVAFQRGDANVDGRTDIADPVWILNALVRGGPPSPCDDAADANDDGVVDIVDPVFLVQHRFLHGPQPPSPFPTCGVDATTDPIGCEGFDGCR